MHKSLTSLAVSGGLIAAALVGGIAMRAQGQTAPPAPAAAAPFDTGVLRAEYEQWRTQFKTWGKWAPVGQESRGTMNLVTPEKVASAMRLAKEGIVVSLAHAEPQVAAADVGPPGVFHRVTNVITDGGTTDNYQVSYHGQTVAHIDSWCHFFENGQMYNGVSVKENVTPENGCTKGSVMNWRGGVTTRAVIYDIPQLKGVDWIDPSTPIRRADLEAWEVRSGVKIGPGDIPLLYTGRWKRRAAAGPWSTPVAGYYPDTLPWIHERLPAFIGHDFNIDWAPRPGWEGMRNPIHVAVLIWMGINIVECLDLEELITTARRLNRYEAVISFAPLPVEGGTGSPVNPLVTF
ncbi:MAG TPA: cyclase family protein [Xanthobacteraceae bacterium]|nr:cyclase family protein [Xanthobacteraceae bacterium]